MGLKCPKCGSEQLAVVDSRPAEEYIRRRRECLKCGTRFTTYEGSSFQKKSEMLEEIKFSLLTDIAKTVNKVIADAKEVEQHEQG